LNTAPLHDPFLVQQFPECFPSIPLLENRQVRLDMSNPFAENIIRHSALRQIPDALPGDGAVNGYLKFRFNKPETETAKPALPQNTALAMASMGKHHRNVPTLPGTNDNIPCLPPDFGRNLKLDSTDNKLLKFCKHSSLT
jgi:hypothetical protein